MIKRCLDKRLKENLEPNKVVVIYGPRQVGKTTLVKKFLEDYKGKVYQSAGENAQLKSILGSSDFSKIIPYFSGYDLIFIDEAQKIDQIGNGLKIIVDQIKGIKVIATGSSSFDLSNQIGEPLVGRQKILTLFPVAVSELIDEYGAMYVKENLENLLVFGSYPKVITTESFQEKMIYLNRLRDGYLYKDILELDGLRNSRKILDLLRLLAFQIGKEVSLQELGRQLGMSKNTVEKYLDLLEKAFVIFNIRGLARNLRKEVSKMSRYYFYDNGARNAVIDNFNLIASRDDVGQLWENFILMERIKKQDYQNIFSHNYFWRTWDQQEIDWVEEREGKFFGYEFKWSEKKKTKIPKDWIKTYSQAKFKVVNKENFLEFVG